MYHRRQKKFIRELNLIISEIHSKLTGGSEKLVVEYVPFVNEDELGSALSEYRKKDIKYKCSCAGPHKDDLVFNINGKMSEIRFSGTTAYSSFIT